MKNKLFSSLVVLALLSSSMAPVARAAEETPTPAFQVTELQGNEAAPIAADHAAQINKMSTSEIQVRLGATADAIDSYTADPANNLSPEQQAQNKDLSMNMRKKAADPKLKKNLLRILAHSRDTALVSFAIIGSTSKQAALLPVSIIGGLIEGLATGHVDKNFRGERVFESETSAAGLIIIECLLYGAESPLTPVLLGGLAIDVIAHDTCNSPRKDAYAQSLCGAFNGYDHAIDNGVLVGSSGVGAGINRGIYYTAKGTEKGAVFLFKGSEKLARKIFKKKKK